jgi:hypothetical protein
MENINNKEGGFFSIEEIEGHQPGAPKEVPEEVPQREPIFIPEEPEPEEPKYTPETPEPEEVPEEEIPA